MPLCIVSSPNNTLAVNTYVYRYDDGYCLANMQRRGRRFVYLGDKSDLMIPRQALDKFVTVIASRGGGDYYWKNGEIHRKMSTVIWVPEHINYEDL